VKDLNIAVSYLKKADSVLGSLIEKIGIVDYQSEKDIFESLVFSIIGQQLSGKAAETIYNRFQNLFLNQKFTPDQILKLDPAQIRAVGTSWAKAASLQDLSQKVLDGTVDLIALPGLSDQEIINHLVQVKGIGPWSAQMRLMFSFHRPDIFPLDDVGIQNALVKHYGLNRKHKNMKQKMLKIARNWRPYRTVACWYLWASLDNRP
jgi:DNA-3-methyladenine glycosylase II